MGQTPRNRRRPAAWSPPHAAGPQRSAEAIDGPAALSALGIRRDAAASEIPCQATERKKLGYRL
ncbi:hypothetical protein IFM12276_24290 [Nocardia sputorum]|uniref:Uncharacterized protein n=1 Tax=Nocardia sputorum TaxID=2984338 RepID=A0ABM8CWP0_9NOCA|nr:hypothetical protein IFM12276_24290 [Nocardia sputorum]